MFTYGYSKLFKFGKQLKKIDVLQNYFIIIVSTYLRGFMCTTLKGVGIANFINIVLGPIKILFAKQYLIHKEKKNHRTRLGIFHLQGRSMNY